MSYVLPLIVHNYNANLHKIIDLSNGHMIKIQIPIKKVENVRKNELIIYVIKILLYSQNKTYTTYILSSRL